MGVIRELLLAAFTVEELGGLFSFAINRELRPVVDQFSPEDDKPAMVRKAVAFCRYRFLLDELLAEVKEANPGAYAHFEDRLSDAVPVRGASAPAFPLPADSSVFCGRDALIEQILTRLCRHDAVPMVGIHGLGGAGKTALAVRVAQRLVAGGRFGDVQLVIDLKGTGPEPVDPAEALASLISAVLGPDPARPRDLGALAGLWRRSMHGRDAILILDNAADAAQVRSLLPGCESCAVLVTSRQRFVLPGAARLDLEPLRPAGARALLQALVPRLDPAGADAIAAACGRLPLALWVAASDLGLAEGLAPEVYAGTLARERARLQARGVPDPDAAAAILISVTRLDPVLRRAWAFLSLFPAPFTLAAAAALWGVARERAVLRPVAWADDLWAELQEGEGFDPQEWDDGRVSALQQLLGRLAGPLHSRSSVEPLDEDETGGRLHALCDRSLLSYDRGSDRYRQHDLIRVVAACELDALEARIVESARLRLARYYEKVAAAAETCYKAGGKGVAQGLALLDLEWPHIRATQAWAASRAGGGGEAAWLCTDYPGSAANLLSLRLHPLDWVAWLEEATRAARRLGDREAEANHLGRLARAYLDLGKWEESVEFYQQAISVARKSGDRRSEGIWLGELGRIYLDQGQKSLARGCWVRALSILDAVQDPGTQEIRRLLAELEA